MLYLVPVLAAAGLYGLRQGLAAALASTLAYNFFFTEPLHSLAVDSAADIVTLVMLFALALVVSQLAARMRGQARIAAANAARNATIAGFAGRLLSSAGEEEIGCVTCEELARLFDANAVMVARDAVVAGVPDAPGLTPADRAAADWVLANGESAGRGAPRLNPAEWLFFPVRSGERILAALGLARDDGAPPVPEEQKPLLESLLDQAALALERAVLEGELRDVAALRERDRLRGALLSSVGHDLRTPQPRDIRRDNPLKPTRLARLCHAPLWTEM
jgi:two-component system sensor histidine kinase KdpD